MSTMHVQKTRKNAQGKLLRYEIISLERDFRSLSYSLSINSKKNLDLLLVVIIGPDQNSYDSTEKASKDCLHLF
jgi:hypothetical protein